MKIERFERATGEAIAEGLSERQELDGTFWLVSAPINLTDTSSPRPMTAKANFAPWSAWIKNSGASRCF